MALSNRAELNGLSAPRHRGRHGWTGPPAASAAPDTTHLGGVNPRPPRIEATAEPTTRSARPCLARVRAAAMLTANHEPDIPARLLGAQPGNPTPCYGRALDWVWCRVGARGLHTVGGRTVCPRTRWSPRPSVCIPLRPEAPHGTSNGVQWLRGKRSRRHGAEDATCGDDNRRCPHRHNPGRSRHVRPTSARHRTDHAAGRHGNWHNGRTVQPDSMRLV